MPKGKKKLSELSQTDGKLRKEDTSGQYEPTTLAQLWGEGHGTDKYGTLNIEEYRAQLKDMNTASLREHAIEVAHIVPGTNRERLEKRLEAEFLKHVKSFTQNKIERPKEKEPTKEVLKIMEEVK